MLDTAALRAVVDCDGKGATAARGVDSSSSTAAQIVFWGAEFRANGVRGGGTSLFPSAIGSVVRPMGAMGSGAPLSLKLPMFRRCQPCGSSGIADAEL